jgi:predicted secreted Zn-dependent protease
MFKTQITYLMETMTSSTSIEKEHFTWLKHMDFYKVQLSQMEKELQSFAKESSSKKVSPRIEQFQNQFIRQREVMDVLRHNIKQHENEIERMTRFALEYLRDRVTKDHMVLRAEYRRFIELFISMEQDFHDFLA